MVTCIFVCVLLKFMNSIYVDRHKLFRYNYSILKFHFNNTRDTNVNNIVTFSTALTQNYLLIFEVPSIELKIRSLKDSDAHLHGIGPKVSGNEFSAPVICGYGDLVTMDSQNGGLLFYLYVHF